MILMQREAHNISKITLMLGHGGPHPDEALAVKPEKAFSEDAELFAINAF